MTSKLLYFLREKGFGIAPYIKRVIVWKNVNLSTVPLTLHLVISKVADLEASAMLLYLTHPQKVMGLHFQSFLRSFPGKKWRAQDIVVRLLINL
jgi:hypothetical protein